MNEFLSMKYKLCKKWTEEIKKKNECLSEN